jgi:hypothetical protein
MNADEEQNGFSYLRSSAFIGGCNHFTFPRFSILAQVSRNGTVRLKTSFVGVVSGSTQK